MGKFKKKYSYQSQKYTLYRERLGDIRMFIRRFCLAQQKWRKNSFFLSWAMTKDWQNKFFCDMAVCLYSMNDWNWHFVRLFHWSHHVLLRSCFGQVFFYSGKPMLLEWSIKDTYSRGSLNITFGARQRLRFPRSAALPKHFTNYHHEGQFITFAHFWFSKVSIAIF